MDKINFKQLLQEHPECVSNGAKIKAFLKDLYPDVPKAIVNTLTIMANDGIISEMQMSAESSTLVAARLQKKLEDDYGLSQKIISECFSLIIYDSAKQPQTTNNARSHEKINASAVAPSKSASKKENFPKNTTKSGKKPLPQSTPAKGKTTKQTNTNFAFDPKDFEIVKGVLKKYKGRSSVVVIPDSVTSVGDFAFSCCSRLTSITVGNSVTSIGNQAFRDCTGLTSITIPDSVTSIGACVFSGCTGLTRVTIPDSVTYIGQNAFKGCTRLTSITIPDSVTSIGARVFSGCTGLTSVTIGDSVTSIKTKAFRGCTGLTSITIPDSVKIIGDQAFYDTAWYKNQPNGLVYAGKVAYKYKGLTSSNISITLREGTLGIADSAFKDCSGLINVTIPDSVTSVGRSAFRDCTGLTSITIPDSVTEIGYNAFSGTAWYKNKPDGLVYAGRVAYRYKGQMPSNTSIVIKDSTLGIADYAFYNCSGLTSITIPSTVTSIGKNAFNDCSGLTSVTIGNSVTSIGSSAFRGCKRLTSITYKGTMTQWKAISKDIYWNKDVPSSCTIYCADGFCN